MEPDIGHQRPASHLPRQHRPGKRPAPAPSDLDDSSDSSSSSHLDSSYSGQKKIRLGLQFYEGTAGTSQSSSAPLGSVQAGANARVLRSRNPPSQAPPRDPQSLPPLPSPHPPFSKRGVGMRWRTDTDVASRASLYSDTVKLLSKLSSISFNILNKTQETPIVRPSSSISFQLQVGNSLGMIAGRIQNQVKHGMDHDFDTAITFIQFALKLEILKEAEGKDITTLIKERIESGELVGCTDRQGKRWRGWGSRLIDFVGSGKYSILKLINSILTKEIASIYGLSILACDKSSTNVYKELPEAISLQICDLLRSPKKGMDPI